MDRDRPRHRGRHVDDDDDPKRFWRGLYHVDAVTEGGRHVYTGSYKDPHEAELVARIWALTDGFIAAVIRNGHDQEVPRTITKADAQAAKEETR